MAGGILVYALHDDEGSFNKNSLGAISEAAKLAGELGTEAAVLIYFLRDIIRIIGAWFRGLFSADERGLDYRIGWYVIFATIPIGLLGFVFKDQIRTGARNLWLIATMLIVFSAVIVLAERYGKRRRPIEELTLRDGVTMGLAQCLALIPGVSRSGATASAGLFLGLQREAAVRFSTPSLA